MAVQQAGRVTAGSIARWLHTYGLVDYRPVEAGGDCFIGIQPADPDACVTVVSLGGDTERVDAFSWDARDEFRIIVRGARGDIVGPRSRTENIVASLLDMAGACPIVLAEGSPDEGRAVMVMPSSAANAGLDPEGRIEWVLRVRVLSTGWRLDEE